MAASYGLTHQRAPEAKASVAIPIIVPAEEAKEIAASPGGDKVIGEQVLRKEDRLVTGSIPKHEEIALPVIDPKAKADATKKKKSTVAKAQTPTSFADDIKPEALQRR